MLSYFSRNSISPGDLSLFRPAIALAISAMVGHIYVYKKCGDEDLKQEFKLLKRQVQKSLRRLYWRHVENLISDDVTNPTSSKKKFWSFIKARRTEGMGVSPLKDTGKLIANPKEQAQLLNNQFCSVFSPRDTVTAEEFQLRCPPPPPPNQIFLRTQTAKTSTLLKKE